MAKGDNRLKILYVIDIFKQNSKNKKPTDRHRFLSANNLVQTLLKEYEMTADRKSIYGYIQSMEQYGYEFEKCKKGFYLVYDPHDNYDKYAFETAELKMIADALSLSHFYPAKKTKQIIRKLDKLLPDDSASLQNNNIFLENLVKSDNASVIYNIDSIYKAINQNKQISFHYYNIEVQLHAGDSHFAVIPRSENGKIKEYVQSPYYLLWKNDGYYLITYDNAIKNMRTFRVDRMFDVIVLNGEDNNIADVPRKGKSFFDKINITEYSNTVFDMFGGEMKTVTLRVRKSLAKVIVDKFGKNVAISPDTLQDDNFFLCSVNIQQSNTFFSWLSGFGADMQVTSPDDVRLNYLDYLRSILNSYNALS